MLAKSSDPIPWSGPLSEPAATQVRCVVLLLAFKRLAATTTLFESGYVSSVQKKGGSTIYFGQGRVTPLVVLVRGKSNPLRPRTPWPCSFARLR